MGGPSPPSSPPPSTPTPTPEALSTGNPVPGPQRSSRRAAGDATAGTAGGGRGEASTPPPPPRTWSRTGTGTRQSAPPSPPGASPPTGAWPRRSPRLAPLLTALAAWETQHDREMMDRVVRCTNARGRRCMILITLARTDLKTDPRIAEALKRPPWVHSKHSWPPTEEEIFAELTIPEYRRWLGLTMDVSERTTSVDSRTSS